MQPGIVFELVTDQKKVKKKQAGVALLSVLKFPTRFVYAKRDLQD